MQAEWRHASDEHSHTEAGPESLMPAHQKPARRSPMPTGSTLIEPLIVYRSRCSSRIRPTHYTLMDFDTRETYRKRVADIARHSDCTELQVAQAALDLALESGRKATVKDPRHRVRRAVTSATTSSIKGFPQLASRVGFHPRFIDRIRTYDSQPCRRFLYHRHSDHHRASHRRRDPSPLLPTYPIFGGLTLAVSASAAPGDAGRGRPGQQHHHCALQGPRRCPSSTSAKGIPDRVHHAWSPCPRCCSTKSRCASSLTISRCASSPTGIRTSTLALLTDLPDSVSEPRGRTTPTRWSSWQSSSSTN